MLELRDTLTAAVGGAVAEVHEPASQDDLVRMVGSLRERQRDFRILGGGSNVIAADGPLGDAIVCTRRVRAIEPLAPLSWRVEAGANLTALAHQSSREGLTGLECCAGIPGTLGAAIRINAGGKFGSVAGVVREVTLLTREGRIERRATTPADFGYRRSAFLDDVILEARLEFLPLEPDKTRALVKEVLLHKRTTQPLRYPSAGCIFRNPAPDRSAGRLIDEAGLKGTRVGGAMVSPLHANYIVNVEAASASDFLALIEVVRARVRDRFGVSLELEVEVWR